MPDTTMRSRRRRFWTVSGESKQFASGTMFRSLPLRSFPYGHPAVATVIPGGRTRAKVEQNVVLLQVAIPADLWRELKAEGLMRHDAPCPVDGAIA